MFNRCLENFGGVRGCGLKVLVRCFSFYSFKRASRSHAKTGFFIGPKLSSHAGKTHFFGNLQVFSIFRVFQKRCFTCMGALFSCFLMFFLVFAFFCVLGGTSKIAVLPAWELNFRKLDQQFYVFLTF